MTQTSINTRLKASDIPSNWKQEESVYTGDNLIDAYLKGKQDGTDELKKILNKQFKNNIDHATKVSEKLLAEAALNNINLKAIHLKAEGITKFSALFVAEKDDFLSDKFREILISSRKLKKEVESDSFYMSFSFVPNTKELNEKAIYADGYFLKYERK